RRVGVIGIVDDGDPVGEPYDLHAHLRRLGGGDGGRDRTERDTQRDPRWRGGGGAERVLYVVTARHTQRDALAAPVDVQRERDAVETAIVERACRHGSPLPALEPTARGTPVYDRD